MNNFYNPQNPVDPRPPNTGAGNAYPRHQGGGVFSPQGMFDPHAQRGWDRGSFQLDPDQQQRYNASQQNLYGSGNSYVQMSGTAPWAGEIIT